LGKKQTKISKAVLSGLPLWKVTVFQAPVEDDFFIKKIIEYAKLDNAKANEKLSEIKSSGHSSVIETHRERAELIEYQFHVNQIGAKAEPCVINSKSSNHKDVL